MGGEKLLLYGLFLSVLGSPPRGRGKALFGVTISDKTGITPAWAGKSHFICDIIDCLGDHPRVGGEKLRAGSTARPKGGSPPRGRGKAQRLLSHSDPLGITPAWAGKSRVSSRYGHGGRDHPRVGGEKGLRPQAGSMHRGSPPRGRGKADQPARNRPAFRITPAWAGKRKRAAL